MKKYLKSTILFTIILFYITLESCSLLGISSVFGSVDDLSEKTASPSLVPTPEPSGELTPALTEEPTPVITEFSTPEPTLWMTEFPTPEPTPVITEVPTPEPTESPGLVPRIRWESNLVPLKNIIFFSNQINDDHYIIIENIGGGLLSYTISVYYDDSEGWITFTDSNESGKEEVTGNLSAEESEETWVTISSTGLSAKEHKAIISIMPEDQSLDPITMTVLITVFRI